MDVLRIHGSRQRHSRRLHLSDATHQVVAQNSLTTMNAFYFKRLQIKNRTTRHFLQLNTVIAAQCLIASIAGWPTKKKPASSHTCTYCTRQDCPFSQPQPSPSLSLEADEHIAVAGVAAGTAAAAPDTRQL